MEDWEWLVAQWLLWVVRGSHKNHLKGPKKRTEEDDKRFAQSFEKLVLVARTQEGE